ncbi:hypothetical protein LINGRAHAP2_LOCUS18451, partial [Linum grandiflorum]
FSLFSSSQLRSFFHVHVFSAERGEETRRRKNGAKTYICKQPSFFLPSLFFFPKLEQPYFSRITQRVQMDKIEPNLIYLLLVHAILVRWRSTMAEKNYVHMVFGERANKRTCRGSRDGRDDRN